MEKENNDKILKKLDEINDRMKKALRTDVVLRGENPSDLRKLYEERIEREYGDFQGYLGAIGGPNEGVVVPIYNTVGTFYPVLSNVQRKGALAQVLEIMDHQNYLIVQTVHTPYVREPLLLADIAITRPLYWPGLDEGARLLKLPSHNESVWPTDFKDLTEELLDSKGLFKSEKVNSNFVVAYAFLRSDLNEHNREFLKHINAGFLDRTLQGIVRMRFGLSSTPKEIEEGTDRLKQLLPKPLHESIEPVRKAMDLSYLKDLAH